MRLAVYCVFNARNASARGSWLFRTDYRGISARRDWINLHRTIFIYFFIGYLIVCHENVHYFQDLFFCLLHYGK